MFPCQCGTEPFSPQSSTPLHVQKRVRQEYIGPQLQISLIKNFMLHIHHHVMTFGKNRAIAPNDQFCYSRRTAGGGSRHERNCAIGMARHAAAAAVLALLASSSAHVLRPAGLGETMYVSPLAFHSYVGFVFGASIHVPAWSDCFPLPGCTRTRLHHYSLHVFGVERVVLCC